MRPVFWTGLGGADIQKPVNLTAVGADDFAVEFPGEMEGQSTFTYTGRADYRD
jgi:hypothetical protein